MGPKNGVKIRKIRETTRFHSNQNPFDPHFPQRPPGGRGWLIERRCLNLHRKFINNRFCACAVQMLLKMAVNAAICSTFEVPYGKSTSARTTTFNRSRDFAHAQKLIRLLTQGRALFLQITLITFIVEPPKLYSE